MKKTTRLLATILFFLGSLSVTFAQSLANRRFTVELLGRQGILEFSKPLDQQPASGLLILFGATASNFTNYLLANCVWKDGVLSAQIMQNGAPAILPGVLDNGIKLKPTTGTYALVGAICNTQFDGWLVGNSVVLGFTEGVKPLKFRAATEPVFTLLVNDKHASVANGNYSYGWYILPRVTQTPNFRCVHLVRDDLNKEVALYAFSNNPERPEAEALQAKIASYKETEIAAVLNTIFTNGSVSTSQVRPDLATLLINTAQLMYPSRILGLTSEGHGSPEGIMNGFFSADYDITKSLGWIKDIRGSNIDFADFATNCNVSSLFNLSAMSSYVNYVLTSDLTRSNPLPFALSGQRPSENYADYFADKNRTVQDILGATVDKYGALWNSAEARAWAQSPEATANGRTLQSWKQQLTLFDMAKFQQILQHIGGQGAYETCERLAKQKESQLTNYYFKDMQNYLDFKSAIPILFPTYTSFAQHWAGAVLKQVSNRGQFQWDTNVPQGLTLRNHW